MSPAVPLPLTPADARTLRASGDWRALAARGAAMGDEALLAEPEVAYAVAAACRHMGDPARAIALASRVEARAAARGDRRLAAEAANLVGNALFEEGRIDEAEARFETLLESASGWGDDEFTARACNNLGILANLRGRRDRALVAYGRAVAAYQRTGNLLGLAQTSHNLGISYRDLSFPSEADAHFRRAIELAGLARSGAVPVPARTDLETVVALAETERALLRAAEGDGALATAMARRALRRFEELGEPWYQADALRALALAARAQGRDDEAEAILERALRIAEAHAYPLLRAAVQRERGLLLRDTGRPAQAREALREAAGHFRAVGAAAEAEAVLLIAGSLGAAG